MITTGMMVLMAVMMIVFCNVFIIIAKEDRNSDCN
jgi:hypothetical protein